MNKRKKIVILGSTGSIGKSSLKVIKNYRNELDVECLSTNKNYRKLYIQSKIFNVKNLIINDHKSYIKGKKFLNKKKLNIFPNTFEY